MASGSKSSTTRTTRSKASAVPPQTTRTTRAAAKAKEPSVPVPPAPKNAPSRKPLRERDNSSNAEPIAAGILPAAKARNLLAAVDEDSEPIKAFLRIRPHLGHDDTTVTPYLEHLTSTTVRMNDPSGNVPNPSRYRLSTTPQSSVYSFSHIFEPMTTQPEFFTKTTLPLVQDLLHGQSGLFFAYGVTNSGKTHTMQGGNDANSAGIIPRTFDVIFNSIATLQSDGRYVAVRLQGVELAASSLDTDHISSLPQDPALAGVLEEELSKETSDMEVDHTVLQVDRNYAHSVWLSYAEVYNEKIYDLLADTATSSNKPDSRSGPAPSTLLLSRKALALKPSPSSDWDGSQNTGRYISGLRQIRVHSASQAKALLKLGQMHRKVFGTLANSQSSRSHALVTIKLLRGHRGEYDDPSTIQTSRLTLVDLAGSERTKHTQTTGDRLKEAGSINKSLMVLGQCMEVMRSNQKRLAQSLAAVGRVDTRDVKKTLAVVPFRHSKLTEILMDYFIGDGRVVMIVNVNPYDTGFDENSHVMKFAALTREVLTIAGPRKPTPASRKATLGTGSSGNGTNEPHRRKVTISLGTGGRQSEACLDILEEDEELDDEDEDSGLDKGFVGALFDEIDDLHMQLFEAEMRCAIIEAETREEVMQEMEERMRNMERMYMKRIMDEIEQNEKKMDAKIDMLHQGGLLGRGRAPIQCGSVGENEEHMPLSDVTSDNDSEVEQEPSSPLDGKSKMQQKWPSRVAKPEVVPLPDSDCDDGLLSESEKERLIPAKSKHIQHLTRAPPPIFEEDVKRAAQQAGRSKSKRDTLTRLAADLDDLSLNHNQTKSVHDPARQVDPEEPENVDVEDLVEDSVIILPVKAAQKPDLRTETGKKKKRQLNKTPVVTEEEIERNVEQSEKGRRVVRGSRS